MSRKILILLAAVALSACAVFVLTDDGGDASPMSVRYGSDSVGAQEIDFNADGGTGSYTQYVLTGVDNCFYFPTEYKAVGTSNMSYTRISNSDRILLGWSTDRNATVPQHAPGERSTDIVSHTYYAVWGNDNSVSKEFVATNTSVSQSFDYGTSDDWKYLSAIWAEARGGNTAFTMTLYHNGQKAGTDRITTATGEGTASVNPISVTLDAHTSGGPLSKLEGYSFDFTSSTLYAPGVYEIVLDPGYSQFAVKVVYVVYDPATDPSVICHASYGSFDLKGPTGTAVRLPDAQSDRQKGWTIDVNGSNAVFPVGGSYTLVRKDTALEISEYTFDEVNAAGVVGVLAYNANGGTYRGSIAELVPTEGYAPLKDGSIVVKPGKTFVGWNPSGSADDPICPSGYLYDTEDYTEVRAVWTSSADMVSVRFVNPVNGTQSKTYQMCRGLEYSVPVNGIEVAGYTFLGWSTQNYPLGDGTADVGDTITASAGTYYAVFESTVYTYTVSYDGNGGIGQMADQVVTTEERPYYVTVQGSTFSLDGYVFGGWSESRFADSPTYMEGDTVLFNGTATVKLYAVWFAEIPDVPSSNLYVIGYNGNGAGANNVPAQIYRISSADACSLYVSAGTPSRSGYDFRGWSSAPYGEVEYSPGQTVILTKDSPSLTLYAVWEMKGPEVDPVVLHTVTFVGPGGTMRTATVGEGNTVAYVSTPARDGCAFLGWYLNDSKWDFSAGVTEDMVLVAKYLPVFHLVTDGNRISVVLEDVCNTVTVTFSDGFSRTYAGNSIPAHYVGGNSSGTVTVKASVQEGTYTAVSHYEVVGDFPDPPAPADNTTLAKLIPDDMPEIVPVAVLVTLIFAAIAAVMRWF